MNEKEEEDLDMSEPIEEIPDSMPDQLPVSVSDPISLIHSDIEAAPTNNPLSKVPKTKKNIHDPSQEAFNQGAANKICESNYTKKPKAVGKKGRKSKLIVKITTPEKKKQNNTEDDISPDLSSQSGGTTPAPSANPIDLS